MVSTRSRNGWMIWMTFAIGMLLSVVPFPHVEILRPMFLALPLAYWALEMPHKIGMVSAFCLGLAQDVLFGTLLGALVGFAVLAYESSALQLQARQPARFPLSSPLQ